MCGESDRTTHSGSALEQVEERVLEGVDKLARSSDSEAGGACYHWVSHELFSGVVHGEPSGKVIVPVERHVRRREVEALGFVRLLDVVERGTDGRVEGAKGG